MSDLFRVVCTYGVVEVWCASAASAIEEAKFHYDDGYCVVSCTLIAMGIWSY